MTVTRPQLDADVIIVGAGPAGLACALHLARLMAARQMPCDNVFVLEKARTLGAHQLSGAVMDPRGLDELEPGFAADPGLGAIPVHGDALMLFTERHAARSPLTPPPLHNHGNYIVPLSRLAAWLGTKVEAAGVNIFTSVAARRLIFEGQHLVGLHTDDKGIGRDGLPKANFEPGSEIRSPIIVLAEGPRGSLTRQLRGKLDLHGDNPQVYSLGVKEIWELPAERFPTGRVLHTLGWPLAPKLYGGGWIYGLDHNQISIGLMTALEYEDPATDPHDLFQRFKTHPWMRQLLAGGSLVQFGAKATPMGGWYALPPTAGDGWLLIGDNAGFVNSQRLKGIHLAIKSGMLAAECVFAALTGTGTLLDYPAHVAASWIKDELWPVRNFHQGFAAGLYPGLLHAGAQMISGGRGLHARYPAAAGHERMRPLAQLGPPPPRVEPDNHLTFDKVTDVYHSGTRHEEDQPGHLLISDLDICNIRCVREFGNPCQFFCPAHVYEVVVEDDGARRLHLNPSNCVHCKTCDIMDPYQIITWTPPEGGGGPTYTG